MPAFSFIDAYAMFFIYAFIGWIVEVCFYGLQEGKFVNRGFLNGPLCPVYGIGFFGVILLLTPFTDSLPLLFFGSLIITTAIEFLAGFILFHIFKLRWWDYSEFKFNVGGYICLRFSIYWGLACTVGMKVLQPLTMFILNKTPDIIQIVILTVLSVLLIIDLIATIAAINGAKQKLSLIMDASTEIRVVSDKIGSSIYDVVDKTSTLAAPTVEAYSSYKKLYEKHREEEKALAKKNRTEEKAIFDEYIKLETGTISQGRENANNKLKSAISSLKTSERRILKTVYVKSNDTRKYAYRLVRGWKFEKKGKNHDGNSDDSEVA